MLSVVDGTLAPFPREELDRALLQEVQEECKGYTLETLKKRKKTPGGIQVLSGAEEYPVTKDYDHPSEPHDVPKQDVISECALSELPSSIHSDDEENVIGRTLLEF